MYWFFSRNDKLLHFGDLRPIKLGITHTVRNPIQLRHWGLHASRDIMHACVFGHGTTVWKVKLGGTVMHETETNEYGHTLSCGSERTYIAGGVDVADVLAKWIDQMSFLPDGNLPGSINGYVYAEWISSSDRDADKQLLIDMIEDAIPNI